MKHLQDIAIVTHCVPDLAAERESWSRLLGYAAVAEGQLSQELAEVWDTPADRGQRWVLMAPASGAGVYLRLVETPTRAGYWPPVTWGWNATEVLVQDPDALARKLEHSPLQRFGGPGDLYQHPKAPRAMQVLSAAGAMLYFTRIQPGGSRYGLHGARTEVDRIFNVVLGGPSLDDLRAFYSEVMGLRVSDPMPFTMTLAAQACNAPADTLFPICVAPLRARHSILELDEYPENAQPRARQSGALPGGMSMVSFHVPDIEAIPVQLRAAARHINEMPYNGRRVAVCEGPAGEWLELVERCGNEAA